MRTGFSKSVFFLMSVFIIGALEGACSIETEGYLGNLGTVEGNCEETTLPPLSAFGSLSINQNGPLGSVNRLNGDQLPLTNSFQNFQHNCAVDQNVWTNVDLGNGGGDKKMRVGPFLVGIARTGPAVTAPQFNFNQNPTFPNLTADNRMTVFFSATETNGSGNDYFDVQSDIENPNTAVITYTPKNGTDGTIIDYNIVGNVFHDVYYDNLTPALGVSNPLVINPDGLSIPLSIDGGNVVSVPFGTTVQGRSFQFFLQRYNPLGPATFILFAEDASESNIAFTVIQDASDKFIFTATAPFTGFLRLAALSTNNPTPTLNAPWVQSSFFMPEDIANGADTSNPPATCPVEDAACVTNNVQSPSWWKTIQVDTIAPTGMSFYHLFPSVWAGLATDLSIKEMGANWVSGMAGSTQYPALAAMTELLPAISSQNFTQATTYYNDIFAFDNPAPPPYNYSGDFSTNYFLVRFDMMMANNLTADISAYQAGNPIPTYVINGPVDNYAVYAAHRRYIPVSVDVSYTASSVSWSYKLSTAVTSGDGLNKTLVCFPLWKRLQGSTMGTVNTTPGLGEPLQTFIYQDTIKGTLYTAEAMNGVVTFLEGTLPSWLTSTDLFIPSTLTFTVPQLAELDNLLTTVLPNQTIPPPYFPELVLDSPYNAGKTAFMLAKSALWIAYFLNQNGQSGSIVSTTQPYIDNAKSVLTAYLVGRTPGSCYFIADRTSGGIPMNGAGGIGDYAFGPNLQQFSDSGVNFGNYVYNDHHFFGGYWLLTAAMITDWELKYGSGTHWIDLPVLGADNNEYKMRDFVDFIWRDIHNPFKNDPDLPFERYGFPWEGHSIANGAQYDPNPLGRNQESISEDYNSYLGMYTYAQVVLQTTLTAAERVRYETVRDHSLMNLKMTSSSASVQWYKNPTYWKRVATPELEGAIYIGQFSMTTVTNGQVNDNSAQNQTFF